MEKYDEIASLKTDIDAISSWYTAALRRCTNVETLLSKEQTRRKAVETYYDRLMSTKNDMEIEIASLKAENLMLKAIIERCSLPKV